jgi:ABC-type uncharacterized transport system substrate-binding protein
MKKKITILTLCVMLLALCFNAYAQQPAKVARIGYLSSGELTADTARTEAIRLALQERGHVEGQNISIEYRYGEGKVDRANGLAADLVRLNVDIIVVAGGPVWVRAAKNATKTIPIVMVGGGTDPVEAGLIESLARPGGNVTGYTSLSRELSGKRLELLKEAVPKLARVAVLYDPDAPATVLDVKEVLPVAARMLRLTLQPCELRGTDDFDTVVAAVVKQRPDGLYVLESARMRANQKRIVGFALKSRFTLLVRQQKICRSGWAHVLRGGRYRQLPARRILRGQNSQRR